MVKVHTSVRFFYYTDEVTAVERRLRTLLSDQIKMNIKLGLVFNPFFNRLKSDKKNNLIENTMIKFQLLSSV